MLADPTPAMTAMTAMSVAALEARVVRYHDLRPCYNAFIDCRTPGSEAKENFTIIGPGVSENPDQYVHIAEAHGFNIGGARQPPGCVNSQHSHDTAEGFVVHTGTWRFDLGEHGDDAQVVLHPGDTISIPTKTFRGFTNISAGNEPGFLWGLLGQDNPGRVTWAPKVFEMARDFGLVLLENGSLVDTKAGQVVPEFAKPMPATTAEQAAALARYNADQAEKLVVRESDVAGRKVGTIVGDDAPLNWDHGYAVDRIELAAGEAWSATRDDAGKRVLFVHRGAIAIDAADGMLTIGEGDTISLPAEMPHGFASAGGAVVFAVRAV